MSQGGVSLDMGSLHSVSSTIYFLQPMQYFNSEVVQREVLLLQSQVRSARGMECSSSAVPLFSWGTDLQPSRCLCMEKGGHPQLTPHHGGRPSLLGCDWKPSGRWKCSGLAFHPSHPTALSSFLLTYPPRQTMLPWTPPASPITHLPAPASRLFPLTPACLLHLQETELWLTAAKHHHSFSQITTVNHFFCIHHHPNTFVLSLPP